ASPIVTDKIYLIFVLVNRTELDQGIVFPGRIFPGIAEKIFKDNQHQGRFTVAVNPFVYAESNLAQGILHQQAVPDFISNISETGPFFMYLLSLVHGEFEQSFYKIVHTVDAAVYQLKILFTGVVQFGSIPLKEYLGKAADRYHRGTQVMGDRVVERLKLLVRGFKFRSLFCQIPVEIHDHLVLMRYQPL